MHNVLDAIPMPLNGQGLYASSDCLHFNIPAFELTLQFPSTAIAGFGQLFNKCSKFLSRSRQSFDRRWPPARCYRPSAFQRLGRRRSSTCRGHRNRKRRSCDSQQPGLWPVAGIKSLFRVAQIIGRAFLLVRLSSLGICSNCYFQIVHLIK